MKERPILFSGPMVRAILEGRKTKSRRTAGLEEINSEPDFYDFVRVDEDGQFLFLHAVDGEAKKVRCPYGMKGDRLWVRETWRIGAWDIDSPMCPALAIDYFDGPRKEWLKDPTDETGSKTCRYIRQSIDELFRKKVRTESDGKFKWAPGESPLRWRPSIHMPRWASRIDLENASVRVERLHDITDEDAISEGIVKGECGVDLCPYSEFAELWKRINGSESWDANPWVWVVEFRRVEK